MKQNILAILSIIFLGCPTPPIEGPPPKPFSFVGPESIQIGWAHRVVYDPSQPGVVYAGCDDTMGIYRSDDNGESWRFLSAYGAESAWALDVDSQGRIYAGDFYGNGLHVSVDGGQSFFLANGIDIPYINSISVDPLNPGVAYASAGVGRNADGFGGNGLALQNQGAVYKTTDGGKNWEKLNAPTDAFYNRVLVHPTIPDVILASRGLDLLRSIDGGATWDVVAAPEKTPDGLRILGAADLIASFADPQLILAAGSELILEKEVTLRSLPLRSTDGGLTWNPVDIPAEVSFFFGISAHPTDDIYLAFGVINGAPGVLISENNAGTSWEILQEAPVEMFFTGAFDPVTPDEVLLSGVGSGIFRFDFTNNTIRSSDTGMSGTLCDGFVILPESPEGDPERWLASCGNISFGPVVAFSDDQGQTWTRVRSGGLSFEALFIDLLMPALVDQKQPEIVLVGGNTIRRSEDRGETFVELAGAGGAFSLSQGPDGAIYASLGDVRRSLDNGITFQNYGGVPPCTTSFIAADPHKAGKVLAACTDRILITEDGSQWEEISLAEIGAPKVEEPSTFSFDPLVPNRVALVTQIEQDNAAFEPEDLRVYQGSVFTSENGGRKWKNITPEIECALPKDVLYLSDTPGHLLIGTFSGDVVCPDIDGQVLESFDNGISFRNATENLSPAHVFLGGLFEDPLKPGTLFISAWYQGIFQREPLQ